MLDSVILTVDGQTVRPRLDADQMPTWHDMSQGVGTIHVRASANLPAAQAGDHRILFINAHRSEMSVYLANALVPTDRRIEITGQCRDGAQHELTIDYRVTSPTFSLWAQSWARITELAVVGIVAAASLTSRRQVRRIFRAK